MRILLAALFLIADLIGRERGEPHDRLEPAPALHPLQVIGEIGEHDRVVDDDAGEADDADERHQSWARELAPQDGLSPLTEAEQMKRGLADIDA